MGRQLISSGIPREQLYQWQKFYDFDNRGKDVEWDEEADAGGTHVLSSGGGTGCLRSTTGATLNDAVSLNTFQTSSLSEDYPQRVVEVAMRIHIHETPTNKGVLLGWGYKPTSYLDFISDGAAAVDWASKEFMGFFAKAGDENWWCCRSSNNGGTYDETRSNFKINQYEPRSKNGWQTLKVVAERETGDIARIKYFIDPTGFGDFAPVQDQFNDPITHIQPVEDSTSSAIFYTIKNASAHKQRLWIDWWALNLQRSQIVTTGAIA